MAPSTSDRKRRRPATDDATAASEGDSVKKTKVDDQRSSIFVRSLPPSATNETLADFFSQYFPVKHAVVVADQKTKESRGFGFVTFADANDAKEAQKALDKKDWDGRRLRVDIAEPRHRKTASGEAAAPAKQHTGAKEAAFPKPPKLIVRNLPWSIKTSDQLAQLFTSFGKVKFADLPQNKGKLKGFGFVTIRGKPNAEKALEAINGKVIDGRTLAVDWAVDKGTWEQQQGKENQNEKAVDVEEDKEEDEEEEDEDDGDGDGDSVQDNDASDDKGNEPKNRDAQLDADLANFMKNFMQNLEDEDDEDEENKDDEEDEENLEIELDDNEEDATKPAQPQREMMRDNSSTIFVRNLPFATTDEQLKSFFGHFGKIRYARVVMDKVTEKPAGTGFVCFADKADVKACLIGAPRRTQQQTTGLKNSILQDENADPTGKYTMDGRVLQVVQAVGKEEAGNLAENSLAKRREKDKRRLYLLAEGAIGQGSSLYGLLTPVEVRMRQASAVQRKKLVQKNPLLHISLTRLALRNIPRNVGAKELKELARKAVVGFAEDVKAGRRQPLSKEENARDGKEAKEKERERKLKKKGIVRQAKIVFEDSKGSKVTETSGAGKSRGYGFIEYASHRWALMGLRYLNGLQLDSGEGGKKQRLIAEFAIENAQVVQRRRAAEEKANKPVAQESKGDDGDDDDDDEQEQGHGHGHQSGAKVSQPKGKQARRLPEKKGKGPAGKKPTVEDDAPKPTNAKEAMHNKLIARKMSMRRKKAAARNNK